MNIVNLKKRVLFVLWAIPAAWILINANISLIPLIPVPGIVEFFTNKHIVLYPGEVLISVMIFIACYEYLAMLSHFYPKNGFWLIYIYLVLVMISGFIPDTILNFQQNMYILFLLVAVETFVWGAHKGKWQRTSLLFSGTILLIISFFSLIDFYDAPFQMVFPSKFSSWYLSQLGIVMVLATIFLCDSAAYFVGSIAGKRHFSSISPNKTIEGCVAGLVAATVVATLGWYFLADKKFPLILGIIMGVLIGIIAQIGDLLVSLIKRYFRVKDASNLIPGHGGILDRFDSLFFTAPIINLFIIIIH